MDAGTGSTANRDNNGRPNTNSTPGKRRAGMATTARPPRLRANMAGHLLTWRLGAAPSYHRQTKSLTRARRNSATTRQVVTEFRLVWGQIPASLAARPSLNNWFEAHGPFTIPAYFLLDAGSPNALAFFSAIDFKEIYHAVLGMLLSWLHFEFPKQYPLSAARYHQAQTIPLLRERLAQGQHNDETYVIMLCAMQTDALLGDRTGLVAHRRGLEALSQVMDGCGRMNEYCRSIKPKLDFFVLEATKSRDAYQEVDYYQSRPLEYLSVPYPEDVLEVILTLPVGLQNMALQPYAMSLELIRWWAALLKWLSHVNTRSLADSDLYDMHSAYNENLNILERLDPRVAPLERASCIAVYLHMAALWYRQLVYNSGIFKSLRAEATCLALECQPRTLAERDWLIFHGIKIYKHWKTGSVLEQEGLDLLVNLRTRFSEVRRWDTLLLVLQKFPFFGPDMSEWRDVFLEGTEILEREEQPGA